MCYINVTLKQKFFKSKSISILSGAVKSSSQTVARMTWVHVHCELPWPEPHSTFWLVQMLLHTPNMQTSLQTHAHRIGSPSLTKRDRNWVQWEARTDWSGAEKYTDQYPAYNLLSPYPSTFPSLFLTIHHDYSLSPPLLPILNIL